MSHEPLVFVPGLNCTAALFAPQWSSLAAGRAVIVPDHARDETMAGVAERLLRLAPPRFALCGLSMGGYVALEVMRRAPERVTRLALLDTSAKGPTPESDAQRRHMIELAGKGRFAEVTGLLWQKLVASSRLSDEPLRTIVQRMADTIGPDGFARQQRAIMSRLDTRPILGAIRVPSLVLVGEEDAITPPAEAREIAAGIPGSRLVVLPGHGHLTTLEAPDEVSAALEAWLAA